MYPPPIDHRCMEYCYTTKVSHKAECSYTSCRCTPLHKMTIELWNTTTPNMFNI